LNYGHTIGHALESATSYTHFLHGEAVAWGMIAAASMARDTDLCSAETAKRIQTAVLAYGSLPPVNVTANDVLSRLGADKKTIAGAVHFVLPVKVGKVTITSKVPLEIVRAAVDEIRNHV
jgi:3-dehydroquinate synthase